MASPAQEPNPQWNPHAAVAGWIVPGLGHWILGLRKRGVILCIAITSLWLGGILIGGLGVIDRYDKAELGDRVPRTRENLKTSWWFYGQAMIAPSILVDIGRSRLYASHLNAKEASTGRSQAGKHPNEVLKPVTAADSYGAPPQMLTPPYEPSIARVAEQGVLFTALAGLLNLLAIIDVLYCDPEHRRQIDAAEINSPPSSSTASKEAA